MSRGSEKYHLVKDFSVFIKRNGIYIFFIPLFYSFCVCCYYVHHADLALHRFPGRMIGVSTLNNVDVGKRVALFYNSIYIFLTLNALFYLVAFYFTRKKREPLKGLEIFNISSLAGCLLLFLHILKFNALDGIHLIFIIQATGIIFFALKNFMPAEPHKKLFNPVLFSIIFCIAICFFFLFKEVSTHFGYHIKLPFSFFIFLFASLCFLFIALYVRTFDYNHAFHFVIKMSWCCIPLLLLPLFTVLKDEIYLVLNNKGILFFTPFKLYIFLLLLCVIWIYIRTRKKIELLNHVSLKRLLSNYYFPLLILGITTFIYYQPIIVNNEEDFFENANRFLPVMEFFKFHVIPSFDKFNSHMYSEIFSIYLYSILNKLEGIEPLIYDFIFPVSTAMIFYFILKDFTRNPYVALFTVMLFPFAKPMVPWVMAPALLAVYIMYKIIVSYPSVKTYLLLFGSCILFIFWRIDIGVASVLSMIAILFTYHFSNIIKINYRYLLASLGYIFLAAIVIFFLFLAHGTNLFRSFSNEFNYLNSAQSYGYTGVTYNDSDIIYRMQYFVFPALMLILGLYILFKFKKSNATANLKFPILCLLFCIFFYFANYQRGLVRHSFIELSDVCLSSFAFFILSSSVYVLLHRRMQITKFLLFFFSSFLLITGFKFPGYNISEVYDSFQSKLGNFTQIQPRAGINREIDSLDIEKSYTEFESFVSHELKNDETFIDFTNEPMLYYYTQKITPSWFYQSPISMHNDYLQQQFIEKLGNYKTPLLVFSNTLPQTTREQFFNNPDGVPNALCRYRIAEYLYQHYQPLCTLDHLCLWKEKKSYLTIPDSSLHPGIYSIAPEHWNVGMLPYIWANYDKRILQDTVQKIIFNRDTLINLSKITFPLPADIDKSEGNYMSVSLEATNNEPVTIQLTFGPSNGEFDFTLPPGKGSRTFAIRISSQYNWYAENNISVSLYAPASSPIRLKKLILLKGD